MRRWLNDGVDAWWIDDAPPPAEPHVEAVGEFDFIDWTRLIARLDDRNDWSFELRRIAYDAGSFRELVAEPDMLHAEVGRLLDRGVVRMWRRIAPFTGLSAGGEIAPPPPRPPPPPPIPGRRFPDPSPPQPQPPAPVQPVLPVAVVPILSWYQFILIDELGDGIQGVSVAMTTPAGEQTLPTDDGGSVRVDQVPPGQGTAAVDLLSLAAALQQRASRPRRIDKPPPQTADFEVVTPLRAARSFSFPDARPHTVMVVSRTDIYVSSGSQSWRDLQVRSLVTDPFQLATGLLDTLALCSWGQGVDGLVTGEGPDLNLPMADRALAYPAGDPIYVVKAGDTMWGIAQRFYGDGARWPDIWADSQDTMAERDPSLIRPGDVLHIPGLNPDPPPPTDPWPSDPADPVPPWMAVDIDGLHEALFDTSADGWAETLSTALIQPPPTPDPDWDPPAEAAADYAMQLAIVTIEDGPDPLDSVGDGDDAPTLPPSAGLSVAL